MKDHTELSEKLLLLCDRLKAEVSKPPKTDAERGYQLATIRMVALIRREITIFSKGESESISKDDLIKFLDDKMKEHKE